MLHSIVQEEEDDDDEEDEEEVLHETIQLSAIVE